MIRVILSGGLGNQMFQYAAGRALSLKLQSELSVDTFLLRKKTKTTVRNFELKVFNIEVIENNPLKNKLITKSFFFLNKYGLKKLIFGLFGIFRDKKAQNFDQRFNNIDRNITLFGYFQNENYFKAISANLREDFRFISPLLGENADIANKIGSTASVSIHIRRGDYLNPNVNLSLLNIEYYQRAISYIQEKITDPVFYIFSDDINWVKKNLDLSQSPHIFIDWNTGNRSFLDMQLMSLCQHNIIANSSFSWWGAWLNCNPDKIVIAPGTWYKNETAADYPIGFIPEKWVILET